MRIPTGTLALTCTALVVGATGCGGGDGGSSDAQPKTPAGAKAALVAFADAFSAGDGKRACPMFAQDVLDQLKGTKMTCEESIARIKSIFTAEDVKRYKASAVAQTPTVSGDEASIPGRGVALLYRDGRWKITGMGLDGQTP